jgi:hypothetical protein
VVVGKTAAQRCVLRKEIRGRTRAKLSDFVARMIEATYTSSVTTFGSAPCSIENLQSL